MKYIYDKVTCEIVSKADDTNVPDGCDFCVSDEEFDLALYRVIVGAISADKRLTYYTQRARPAEQLAHQIKSMRQAQLDTDTAALDLDYRLTLLENGVKEGEI